ncbi:STAS domain-containing protein [uncultured Cellulomonas sp.]|uniref:STAS domain-containing protein n=1 Tax=uncultured Cellulomonas sp. TaxID=189682 RepID=UPI002639DD62|nr:STAS domain-containing protein [uncultured Cellulomonas sp.]
MSTPGVEESGQAGWPLVRLSGAIDLANVEPLGSRLERAVSNHALGLVLDLSAVTYLDSTGVRLIYRLARQLGDRQQSLRLVVPDGSRIRRVLSLAGVASVALVVHDRADLARHEEESP